jgi:hypothetical protein
MRFWWVNQNQTYRHEVAGSYPEPALTAFSTLWRN